MAWFVYIVECTDKSYYTGICWNLKKRIKQHNEAWYKNSFTKGRQPVKLVYWERFSNRFDAAKRERVIKGYSRLKKSKLVSSLYRTRSLH